MISKGYCLPNGIKSVAFLMACSLVVLLPYPLSAKVLVYTSDAPRPAFEVATVKPPQSLNGGTHIHFNNGLYVAANVTLRQLIMVAYGLSSADELIGGDDTLLAHRIDVEAKEPELNIIRDMRSTSAERQEHLAYMLQSLLAERCNLKTHIETKSGTVFSLKITRQGPLFTQNDDAKRSRSAQISSPVPSGFETEQHGHVATAIATDVPLSYLVDMLSQQPELGGRAVVNETRLYGKYTWRLQWAPQRTDVIAPENTGIQDWASSAKTVPELPGLVEALRSQLGLTLKRTKNQVQQLVINEITLPTGN